MKVKSVTTTITAISPVKESLRISGVKYLSISIAPTETTVRQIIPVAQSKLSLLNNFFIFFFSRYLFHFNCSFCQAELIIGMLFLFEFFIFGVKSQRPSV